MLNLLDVYRQMKGIDPTPSNYSQQQAMYEIKRLQDLLDKSNNLAQSYADRLRIVESCPDQRFAHRLAIMLEVLLLDPNGSYNEAMNTLSEYQEAVREWMEDEGQPYVSGFGKD